jgi:hypothetical protein
MHVHRHPQQPPGEFERRLVMRYRAGAVAPNAILNDPGPLSLHKEMEVRLSNCLLLLLLEAEMTARPIR